jgi:hypothetical protein
MPGRIQSQTTDTDLSVRDYIARELKARKETKVGLARAVGMSPYQMSRRFASEGSWPFQVDEVRRIAEHWGITFQDVLDGSSQERENGG